MKYRELGSTGLRVSEIGLGGEWLQRHTDAEVCAVFDACDECGINVVDAPGSAMRCAAAATAG